MKLLLLFLFSLILMSSCSFEDSSEGTSNSSGSVFDDDDVTLNANIGFSGTQFEIKNNDSFDYPDATLTVNDKYKLKHQKLSSKQTYRVGIMQFADDDGNRFSSSQKPQSFTISSKLSNGKIGFVSATWN